MFSKLEFPIYEVIFDEERAVFNNVSIVNSPAIKELFIKMSDEEKTIRLSLQEDKHIVTGPVLIPDQLILRKDEKGYYYIKFSADTIKKMALEFFKKHRNTEGNVEHSISVNGVTFYESYLIDKGRGIAPFEFKDLPDGTWIMSAKIENKDLWDAIKAGDLNGFSIDAFIEYIPESIKQSETTIDSLDKLFEIINNNKN